MRCLVWGAGAIGGTLGAHLARADHDVTFVDIVPEHVAAINGPGVSIIGPVASFTQHAPAPETLTGSCDTVIFATNAHPTEKATRELLPYLSEDGYVVSAQNGLNE